eukprot:707534-Rhodomonas_salina.2
MLLPDAPYKAPPWEPVAVLPENVFPTDVSMEASRYTAPPEVPAVFIDQEAPAVLSTVAPRIP